jgi:hypothetical protein
MWVWLFLCENKFSFLWDKCPRVWIWGQPRLHSKTLSQKQNEKLYQIFPECLYHYIVYILYYNLTSKVWVSHCLCISVSIIGCCHYFFFISVALIGVKWYLTVVLIYTSQVDNEVEPFFRCWVLAEEPMLSGDVCSMGSSPPSCRLILLQ